MNRDSRVKTYDVSWLLGRAPSWNSWHVWVRIRSESLFCHHSAYPQLTSRQIQLTAFKVLLELRPPSILRRQLSAIVQYRPASTAVHPPLQAAGSIATSPTNPITLPWSMVVSRMVYGLWTTSSIKLELSRVLRPRPSPRFTARLMSMSMLQALARSAAPIHVPNAH